MCRQMRFNNLLGNFAGALLSGSRVSFQHAPKFYGRVNLEPHNASNFHTQNGIFQTASAAVRDRHISQRCPSSAASINPDGNNDDTNSNSRTEPYSECEPRPSPLCWANPDATPPDIHTSHDTNGHTSPSSRTGTTSNPSTRVNKTHPPNTKTKNAPLRHPHARRIGSGITTPRLPGPKHKNPVNPPTPLPILRLLLPLLHPSLGPANPAPSPLPLLPPAPSPSPTSIPPFPPKLHLRPPRPPLPLHPALPPLRHQDAPVPPPRGKHPRRPRPVDRRAARALRRRVPC